MKSKKYKTQSVKSQNQFMMFMALFVVIVASVTVMMYGMGTDPVTVLSETIVRTDPLDQAEGRLNGVVEVGIQGDLDRLDRLILGR